MCLNCLLSDEAQLGECVCGGGGGGQGEKEGCIYPICCVALSLFPPACHSYLNYKFSGAEIIYYNLSCSALCFKILL